MSQRKKAFLFTALILCGILLLSGCRTRVGLQGGKGIPGRDAPGGSSVQTQETDGDTGEDPGGQTRENPEAQRKEFDESAPVQVLAGAERDLHQQGEGTGAGTAWEDAEERVTRTGDQAEKTAAERVAAQEAERMGTSADALPADSAAVYYDVLLRERTGSLFECQRLTLYWETAEDHVTVHRSSPEHALILDAGVYDVSSRLLPENLLVDDGWITRKNPGMIVKIVSGDILGQGVMSAGKAREVCNSLLNRDGWQGIDAVRNHRVLLLSEEIFQPPWPRTAAALLIARTAYPDRMRDVDPAEALRMLAGEAMGTLPAGSWYYWNGEE